MLSISLPEFSHLSVRPSQVHVGINCSYFFHRRLKGPPKAQGRYNQFAANLLDLITRTTREWYTGREDQVAYNTNPKVIQRRVIEAPITPCLPVAEGRSGVMSKVLMFGLHSSSTCLSIYRLSIKVYIYLSIYLQIHLCIYLWLPTPPVYISINPPVYLSICRLPVVEDKGAKDVKEGGMEEGGRREGRGGK